ncbi:MAG: hypothetical protein ACYDGR_09485 [Candidatus Dormibacteria bacterium]
MKNHFFGMGALVLSGFAILVITGCSGTNPGVYGQYTSPDGKTHDVYGQFTGDSTTGAPPASLDGDASVWIYDDDGCYPYKTGKAHLTMAQDLSSATLVTTTSGGLLTMKLSSGGGSSPVSVPTPKTCTGLDLYGSATGKASAETWVLAKGDGSAIGNGSGAGLIGVAAVN